MKSQEILKNQLRELPDAPGVYFFFGANGEVLYVGKATSLCDRAKSYLSRDLLATRGPLLVKMIAEARGIGYMQTDSVLEALLLEAYQIKKLSPPYNTKEKDDKSSNYVIITKEDFPTIKVVRARNLAHWKLEAKSHKLKASYGPFPHGGELREALKIIRRIFPYRDEKCGGPLAKRPCFNFHIGLCPGVCAGTISKNDYRKTVRYIALFFEGKKNELIKDLEKEMKVLAKEHEFEEADKLKRQLYALEHIQDVALIKRDLERGGESFRVEAYDIAHLAGRDAVGVMTVVEDGELAKDQYRKFKIRLDKNDDTANLKEVLRRRLGHPEWRFPNLIVVDGGKGQINAASSVLSEAGLAEMVNVVSVIKDARHRAKEILNLKDREPGLERAILLANSEAHRFAIGYHRKLRSKGFRI